MLRSRASGSTVPDAVRDTACARANTRMASACSAASAFRATSPLASATALGVNHHGSGVGVELILTELLVVALLAALAAYVAAARRGRAQQRRTPHRPFPNPSQQHRGRPGGPCSGWWGSPWRWSGSPDRRWGRTT